MVGLYDLDYATFGLVPFNLELMKYSSYYKSQNRIVNLAPTFAPDRYKKFIVHKDIDTGSLGIETNASNVQFGGYYFSNGLYSPLPPEIEKISPDVNLYGRIRRGLGVFERERFDYMQGASHVRLSTDNKTITANLNEIESGIVYFHDFNINILEEVAETLVDFTQERPLEMNLKFPIQVNSFEDLLKWSSLKLNFKEFFLQYNGIMSDKTIYDYYLSGIERPAERYLIYLVTAAEFTEQVFIDEILPMLFRQGLYLSRRKIPITFMYHYNFFENPIYSRLLDLFNYFNRGTRQLARKPYLKDFLDRRTLLHFVRNLDEVPYSYLSQKYMSRKEARKLFKFVQENNYELFKDFYHLSNLWWRGGKLQ